MFFLGICITSYSQVNRYSKSVEPARYQPRSFSELSNTAMTLQQRYNENQKYLYDLKKWVLELKSQISEKKFIERLNGEYSVLTSIEGDDLARATKILNQREMSIRELISEYDVWLRQKNKEYQPSSNYSQNDNPTENFAELGYELHQNGEFAKAIYNYTLHLKSDENNTDIIFLRALCKSELGDRYGAIRDYDQIIEKEMAGTFKRQVYKMSTVYNNKAYCLVNLGKYEEALPLVNKALDMDISEAYIWDTRGELYFHIGEYDKSIADMDKALAIEESANSYFYRGLAYLKIKNKSKACSDLSKAGELGNSIAYQEIVKNCN